jgi:HlyD family secretion protein
MIHNTSAMDTPVDRAPRRLSRTLLIGGAAALVLLVVGFVAVRPLVHRWASAQASIERSRLRLATVSRGDLVYDVAVQGRVVAASRPTLFSPSAGIVSVKVREGEKVDKAAVLAIVDSPEIESRLRQERATLDALRSDLSRLKLSARQGNLENRQTVELDEVRVEAARRAVQRADELASAGLISTTEREEARDTLSIATIELAQARKKVELETEAREFEVRDAQLRLERQELVVAEVGRQVEELTIRAPFAGLVATVPVEDRDAVVRGQAVVGVVDLSDLEVEVNIPESYADDVSPGLEAEVLVDNERRPGTLTRVAPEVRSGQVEGRVAFAGGTPPGLRQNQRLSTRLILARESGVLKVPRGPFLEAGGARWVYVVKDGLARRRKVDVGAVSVTEVQILGGVDEGEEVILSDLSQLQGAETVRLR